MRQFICTLVISIIFSSQYFAQWNKVEQITSPFIYSVLFDDNDIYVGGDSLYISRDKGKTWEASIVTNQPIEITALFKYGGKLFAGTYGSGVYISSNNGMSWQSFNLGLMDFAFYAKKFVLSGDTIFYATDGGGVYYLLKNTNEWHEYNQNLPSQIAWTINDIAVTNKNLIVSAGASGYYYLRPKGSPEWIEKRIQTPGGIYTTPNAFLSTGDIVFSGSRFGIYKSIDEGNSFDSVGISAMDISVVCFVKNNNRIYAGYTRASGNDFFVWYSDDFGINWNILDHQFQFLRNLYINDNKIWAATNDGLWFNELETTSSDPIVKPINFNLEQNYPNPFNPSTSIRYAINSYQFVSLKVFDILGREVKTLVDEYKSAGIYEAKFDASSLSSGVYFYRLKTDTDVEIKKMVFLK